MTRRRTPARDYPPGFFTALVVQHNWPPRFEPRFASDLMSIQRQQASFKAREKAATEGVGWGHGTVMMPNTPVMNGRPTMMAKAA